MPLLNQIEQKEKGLHDCINVSCILQFQDGDRMFIGAPGAYYWQGKFETTGATSITIPKETIKET